MPHWLRWFGPRSPSLPQSSARSKLLASLNLRRFSVVRWTKQCFKYRMLRAGFWSPRRAVNNSTIHCRNLRHDRLMVCVPAETAGAFMQRMTGYRVRANPRRRLLVASVLACPAITKKKRVSQLVAVKSKLGSCRLARQWSRIAPSRYFAHQWRASTPGGVVSAADFQTLPAIADIKGAHLNISPVASRGAEKKWWATAARQPPVRIVLHQQQYPWFPLLSAGASGCSPLGRKRASHPSGPSYCRVNQPRQRKAREGFREACLSW